MKGTILPVGYPVRDKEVLLLDDMGRESSDISTGEIAVRSRYLASGYWRNPELTRAKFVEESGQDQRVFRTGDLGQRAPDGCLTHLGRKDFRVKVRGFSVDVGEIESVPAIGQGTSHTHERLALDAAPYVPTIRL